jgi:hypothetical protein
MRRWFNGYVVMQWVCAALGGSVGAVLVVAWGRPGWMVAGSFVVSTVVVFGLGWALDRFFGTGRVRRPFVHRDLTPPGPWDHLVPDPFAEGKERSDP